MVLAFSPGDKSTLGSSWTSGSMSVRGRAGGRGCRLSFRASRSGSGSSKSHQEQDAEEQVDASKGDVGPMQPVL